MLVDGRPYRTFLKTALLLPLIVFYVLVRILAILTPSVSQWSVFVDEMPTGNIAHDLGTGLILHFPLYQFKPYAAGTVLEGILAYPMIRIFGESLFGLKCAAILIGLATMVLWYLFLWRYAGAPAALFSGLLFVFAPFVYINLTITAWGNHTESALFTSILFLFLFWAYYDRSPVIAPPWLPVFLAGLAAGFGTYFTYTCLVTFLFGLMVIVLMGGKVQWKGPVWLYLAGAVVGFSPILSSIRAHGLPALGRIDTYAGYAEGSLITAASLFLESRLISVPGKFFSALTSDIPKSFCFPEIFGMDGFILSVVFYLFVLLLTLSLLVFLGKFLWTPPIRIVAAKKSRDQVNAFLLASIPGFALFYLLAFSFSGFRVIDNLIPVPGNFFEYRYFAPLYPVFFAMAGLGFGAVLKMTASRIGFRFLSICLALLVLVGLMLGPLGMIHGEHDFIALTVRSDFYSLIVERVAMEISKQEELLPGKILWIRKLPHRYHPLFFENLGSINLPSFHLATSLVKRIDPDQLRFAYRGMGRRFGRETLADQNGNPVESMKQILLQAEGLSAVDRAAFLEGAGEGVYFALQPYLGDQWMQTTLVNLSPFWNTMADADDRNAVMTGVGRGIGSTFVLSDEGPITSDPHFWIGVGCQLRRNAEIQLLRNDLVIDTIEHLPAMSRPWIYAGWRREGREVFVENGTKDGNEKTF